MRYALFPESHAAHEAPRAEVERMEYPAPVVTSRDAWPDGVSVPSPVAKLEGEALGWGWQVRCQYSRGCMPHATTGRPGAVKDAFALRFGGRACAVYRGGVWESVWIWGPDLPPNRLRGVTELREWLRCHPARVADHPR